MKNTVANFYQKLWQTHPFLMKMGVFNCFLAVCCLVSMSFDSRQLVGVSVWLKPMKFAVSIGIFCFTMTWLLSIYKYSEKWLKRTGNFFAALAFIEILTIIIPAIMGVKSHYNMSNPISAINFLIMGLAIHSTVLGLFIMAIQSFFNKINASQSMVWAIRLAWITMFLAFWGGEIMIGQSAHNIGVPDGGEGLPVTNWSTTGGDLRVMHFLGIHAIQILPLMVFFLHKINLFNNQKQLTIASILLGVCYLGVTFFLYHQAMQGQPFL
jgi:hypothetical protein